MNLSDHGIVLFTMGYPREIAERISDIRGEPDVEKRMRRLRELNESLPRTVRLELPSLVTNAYVRRVLDILEERTDMLSLE